jgi:hypothetical protein
MKGWRGAVAIGTLAGVGLISVSPIGSKACLFVQQFESSSKASDRVSLVQRIVYSLIQAERGSKPELNKQS